MMLDPPRLDDVRSVRLAHLREESAVRSVGQLCSLVGSLYLLGAVEFVLVAAGVLDRPTLLIESIPRDLIGLLFWMMAALLLVVAVGHWVLGRGLVRLRSWARWTVLALTGMSLVSWVGFTIGLCFVLPPQWGLLGLVLGGGLHALVLYPLLTNRAGVIFSSGYQEVIQATPEVRVRMHWMLKAGLGSIGVGVIGLIVFLYHWVNS